MNAFAVTVAVLAVAAGIAATVWLNLGPIGQRGRQLRAERNGRWSRSMWGSMIAVVLIVVFLVVTNIR